MEKIFPSEFSEIGRALLDGDYALIENRRVLLTRVRDYVAGLSDGSTVGSPWEAIIAAQLAADTAQLAADTAQGSANNAPADADALDSRVDALEAGVGGNPIAQWNEADLTQFSATGDANWTTTVGAYGPDGEQGIRWEATVGAGTKERFIIFDPGITLPERYTVDVFVGPYSGRSVDGVHRVVVCPIAHWIDSTHMVAFGPQGNNTGSDLTQNIQVGYADGGGLGFGAFMANALPNRVHTKGRFRMRVQKSGSQVFVGLDVLGGKLGYTNTYSVATASTDKVGFRIAHFGESQAIGDRGYIYGLKIYAGHI